MENLQDVFSKRLKQIIQESDMTQHKLARATGLTDVTISRYTNGTRLPGADELLKLSNALSVSVDDLIDLKAGFDECMRVLEPDGLFVFKWNEE